MHGGAFRQNDETVCVERKGVARFGKSKMRFENSVYMFMRIAHDNVRIVRLFGMKEAEFFPGVSCSERDVFEGGSSKVGEEACEGDAFVVRRILHPIVNRGVRGVERGDVLLVQRCDSKRWMLCCVDDGDWTRCINDGDWTRLMNAKRVVQVLDPSLSDVVETVQVSYKPFIF